MKKQLLLLILGLSTTSALFAQKEKKHSLNDETTVIYNVNSDNEKNGPYYIKSKDPEQILLKGAYNKDKRTGSWYFYNTAGKLETCFNYNEQKLLYIDSVLLRNMAIEIVSDNPAVKEKSTVPVLLSPVEIYMQALLEKLVVPIEHFTGSETLPVKLKAKISTSGDTEYSVSYKYNGIEITKPLLINSKHFSIEWVPAKYDQKPLASEVSIATVISNSKENDGSGHRRFRWNESQ